MVCTSDESFWELYTLDANGTHKLESPAPLFDIAPKWSPDGSQIVFVSFRNFNTEIYVANADGTNQRRLTNHPAGDWDPEWSPDGQKIIFASDRDGDFDLYIMDADGTNVVQLTNAPGDDRVPEWRRPARTGTSPGTSPGI